MEDTTDRKKAEESFETGMDEAFKLFSQLCARAGLEQMGLLFANQKRTFDEYQNESLESIRSHRSYAEKVLSDAQQNDNERNKLSNLALSNAITNSDMITKQAIRHTDIAIDREWNLDEHNLTLADILKSEGVDDAVIAKILAAMAKTPTGTGG